MREAFAFLLLACACGASTWKGHGDGTRKGDGGGIDVGSMAEDRARGDRQPGGRGFAALERQAEALAPGLLQVAESESGGERVELVRAVAHDACVRVAFEATAPVVARLVDGDAAILAETRTALLDGALAERGPVCIRKGETVSAVATGMGARIKWIAWASP